MNIVQKNLRILNLFLVVLICSLPSFAVESSTLGQSTQPRAAFILNLQPESWPGMTSFDCSHFVHELYDRVGLHYEYANSHALYRGIEEFQRVVIPSSGDLVVWRGHTGIVVDPSQHSFLSALKTGIKTSSYVSRYWKRKGPPRFFRFSFSGNKSKEMEGMGEPTRAAGSSAPLGDDYK
jgi:hypothetical protein